MKESKVSMNAFTLKIIAIISMTIDHYCVIVGGPEWFRIIGRLAFPIFAFLIGEGFRHTRNKEKYLMRMLIAGILLYIPLWTGMLRVYYPNIFLTLSLGIIALFLISSPKLNIFLKIFALVPILWAADYYYFDYKMYGVLLIVAFYLFRENKVLLSLSLLILNFMGYFLWNFSETQFYSMAALPLLFLYNGQEGKKMKYFFYLYYPAHILVLHILSGYI